MTTTDPRGDHDADLVVEAPGTDEIVSVPWPLLLRHRVQGRIEGHDRGPWIVLATALFGLLSVSSTITILAVSMFPQIAVLAGLFELVRFLGLFNTPFALILSI